jgi:hypothetical protein
MEARDIKRYLADLGAALKNRGVKKPLRMMLIGGAYMLLLENAPRSTEDIDIFWLEEDAFERMREVLSACMLEVARKHMLPPNWFNFLTQVILMQDIYIPDGTLWKRFGPLYIYIPPREYILPEAQEEHGEQIEKSLDILFSGNTGRGHEEKGKLS